ncbi:hypothetical protein [Candidatus Mycoplasma haematohominis]|uniref:Uncharacterized protein n=1 Tax=Candidatus Mycoplasma haematohominis TaxID=1494318 RepID=A0A478FT53_9MOLU|nr:hypothetical protein [Candidatus Mycoplasma haemohominis]GCE63659.1 hypothetical protein MHSWG343_06590 [Candidatus Mycoplasma haemohominis]
MSAIKAAAAAAFGTAILGGGGYLIWDSFTHSDIKYLNTDGYGDNTFGKKHAIYLIDPYHHRNKSVWEKSFDRWDIAQRKTPPSPTLSTEFGVGKFEKGYVSKREGNSKVLNLACEDAFKVEDSSLTSQRRTNTWIYCSVFGVEPKLVSSETGQDSVYKDKHGGKTDFKGKLVEVKEGNNYINAEFWKRRDEEFFDSIKLEKASGEKSSDGSIFRILYDKKNQQRGDSDTVKHTCEKAYNKAITGGDASIKFTDEDIKRFCYLVPEGN